MIALAWKSSCRIARWRTAVEQVLGAVDERLRAARTAGVQATVAGHRVPVTQLAVTAEEYERALADSGARAGWDVAGDEAAITGARVMSVRELISESAAAGGHAGGRWNADAVGSGRLQAGDADLTASGTEPVETTARLLLGAGARAASCWHRRAEPAWCLR